MSLHTQVLCPGVVCDWSHTVAGERVSVWAGDDSDSVIGQFLQVRDQLQQTRTRLVDDPARVGWVRSVVRIQNLQSVEVLQLLQVQEVAIWHVIMSETQGKEGYYGNQHPFVKVWRICSKKRSSGVSDSPDPEYPQVREQLWEESDHVGGGAPGLQVQVFQVRSSVWDHLQVFRLQIHTESQTEEGGRQEVSVHRQRMASYWTDRVR